MQTVKRRIRLQWLSLSFVILSVGIFAYGWIVTPNTYFFVRMVTARLNHAQEILQREVQGIKRQLEALPNGPDPMQLPAAPELKKMGASLYVLEGGEMIYWSDAPKLDARECMQLDEELTLRTLVDGLYLVRRQIHNGRSYVTLHLLKHQYAYQNRYLENTFNPYWGIPDHFTLAPSTQQGYMITPASATVPVFSLLGDPSLEMVGYRWWSFWILICGVVVFLFGRNRARLRKPRYLYVWTIFWFSLRYVLLWLDIPRTEGMQIFDPGLCSLDHWGYSIGYILTDAIFMIWISIPWLKYLMRRTVAKRIQEDRRSPLWAILSALSIQILFLWVADLTVHFVSDSTFEMVPHKVLNLNQYSVLAYLIIGLFFFLVLVMEYVFAHIFPLLKRPYLFVVRMGCATLMLLLYREAGGVYFVGTVVLLLISIILSYRKFFFRIGIYLVLTLVSILMVYMVTQVSVKRYRSLSESIAKRLSNERDPVVEYRMMRLSNAFKIEANLWLNSNQATEQMEDSIRMRYFSSDPFLSYELSFTKCTKSGTLLLEESQQEVSCRDFFKTRITEGGEQVGESIFWFVPNAEFNAEYLAIVPCKREATGDSVYLFVEFYKKNNFGKLGYPELLSNQDQDGWKQFDNLGYSYALYQGNRLIRSFGDYSYPRKGLYPRSRVTALNYHQQKNNYNHHFFYENDEKLIIVSYPVLTFIQVVFSFAYACVFFFLWFALLWFIFGFHRFRRNGLEARVRAMLMVWITVLLIGVSGVSINFNRGAYSQQDRNRGRAKMNSLIASYHRTFINTKLQEADPAMLNQWMVSLSNVVQSDINVYSDKGDFVGTSRKEVLGKGFIGYKMNPSAYRIMRSFMPQRWTHVEQLGTLHFVSVYAPLVDQQGNLLGYANLPHFTDVSEVKKGLSEAIASFVNLYVLFLLLTFPLSKLISYTVTMPLIRLRDKMMRFQLSKKPEQIVYHGNDEIGVLVRAYNRMVSQLNTSANRLASSERDAAWREMARQIAHEIKNPLTPMLLSIQHLMRMKANNTPGWPEQLDKVAETLQNQIGLLASTASAFSDFAKIQETEYQEVDLRSLLESIIPLYETYSNISLELSIPSHPVCLTANREQMQRVLVNFMNNAVQAIGENPLGRIQILVDVFGHECRLVIKDNGVGIPPENMQRLFQPYFTTKTTGTGLGLAISKRIIQNFGGEIFFHSEFGKGASFGFILPYKPKI